MLAILRVFISAAISSQDDSIQQSLTLARRASSVDGENNTNQITTNRDHLLKLFSGSIASDFLSLIDFRNLQAKIFNLIAEIV
jgi:hypothetical protein